MSRFRGLGATTTPLLVIQTIIGISTIIGGLYLVSPFMQASIRLVGRSAFLETASSEIGILIFAAIFIFSGILMLAGVYARKVRWRSTGLFINGLCRFYVIFATFLSQGILPLTWFSGAVIMVIVFYMWGRIRRRGVE